MVGATLAPAAAADPITLTADTGGGVLAGENVSVSLTATNPSTTNYYNVSYQYELPVGVTYQGPTTPESVGEPTVMTIVDSAPGAPVVSHQLLVWRNASDLPKGDAATISFSLAVDPVRYPVGSQIVPIQAGVYAQSNPRIMPKFDPTTGLPVAGSFTASGQIVPDATPVSAIAITKSEESPESELVRGVHDNTTTYTLTVRTSGEGDNNSVRVVDYIPAGLEFLGCGGVDNSTGPVEYPGAPRLTTTPAPVGGCTAPSFVTTVTNPDGLTGVFTQVEWMVGDVPAGQTVTINYRAAIPLSSNTMTWPGATPPADGAQASNLDNNTGTPTRQLDNASGLTNRAIAESIYEGQIFETTPARQESRTTHSVDASDLSIVKTTTRGAFESNEVADFTLRIRASEYVNASNLTIVDQVPNGLCPLVPDLTAVLVTAPGAPTVDPGCFAPGPVSGATVTSVVAEADGTFTLTMTIDPLDRDADVLVTYGALMLAHYTGGNQAPTVAGDSFTNTVKITGETTDAPVTSSPTINPVEDTSEVSIGSSPPTINKRVLPRPSGAAGAAAVDCVAATGYVDSNAPLPIYQLGDRVCFELTVSFSDSTMTRNAQIQDFLPEATAFGGYAVAEGTGLLPNAQVARTSDVNAPVFLLGALDGSDRFVEKGLDLKLYIWATITEASDLPTVDITANLMKYREESTADTVLSLRDQADFAVAPAAVATLAKTITSVDGANPAPANDNAQVREGSAVEFALAVGNGGTVTAGNNFAIRNVTVWDALPAGFSCATVPSATISNAGVCTDPGQSGHPTFTGSATRSAIVWTLPSIIQPPDPAAVVTYVVNVPAPLSVSQKFTNNASIVAFTSPNTDGGDTPYVPRESLSGAPGNATPANDQASIFLPDAVVDKTAAPQLTITNKGASQVVAGETVKYTYSVAVPAGATVFTGVLSDALPTGITIPGSAVISADLDGAALPSGFTVSSTGTLTFPTTWDNTTSAAQIFRVTIDGALVGVALSSGTLTNTASFASKATLNGTAITPRTDTAAVVVVTPVPTLTKAVTPTTAVTGQTLTYTLTANNTSGAPAAFDGLITDCLPSGLDFGAFGTSPSGTVTTSVAGDATNGCATGTTKLTWTLPSSTSLVFNTPVAVTFTATVGSLAAGLVQYPNTATIVTSTLPNGSNDPAVERVISTTSAAAIVTVSGATTVKTLLLPAGGKPTIGQTVKYSLAVTLPANVNFYSAAIIDTLPTVGTPAAPAITPDMSSAVFACAVAGVTTDCVTAGLPGTPSAMTASSNGATVGWMLGSIPRSADVRTVTVEFTATVRDISGNARDGVRANTGRLKWMDSAASTAPTTAGATFDRSGTNSNTINFTVTAPRLTIVKDAYDSAGEIETAPQPGETFTYRLAVTNTFATNGSTAFAVKVVDTVPTGVVVAEGTISNGGVWNSTARTITWDVASIANTNPATVVTLTYDAKLAASSDLGTAALTNTARVTTYQSLATGGRVYTTNPPTDTAVVTPSFPAVTLAKSTPGGTIAYTGEPFSWRLTITNSGTGTAKAVTPTDVLPANWVYSGDATITRGGTTQSFAVATEAIASSVQTLAWPGIPNVAAGETVVINYTAAPTAAATVTPGAGSGVPHTNTFSAVTTDGTDATGNAVGSYTGPNAQASATINEADISVVKSADQRVMAGTTSSAWSITVSNAGVDTAIGPFTITDTPGQPLPAGVTITQAQGTGWSCTVPDPTAGSFTCVRSSVGDTLASGASFPAVSVFVNAAVEVASGTELPNTATVAAKTFDPNLENNTSTSTVSVSTSADLAISKSGRGEFVAGQTATWEIGVSNAGPSVARYPLTVTDTLPAGIDVESVTGAGAGWECVDPSAGDTTFTCTFTGTDAGLGIASTPPITVTAGILSSYRGSLSNAASVESPTFDPNLDNNTARTVAVDVITTTELTITKSRDTEIINPGADFTYHLVVTNVSTPDTLTVSISDPLPAGLTLVDTTSISGEWDCSTSTTTVVNCVLDGPLVGLGTASVDVLVHAASDLPEGEAVINTATVTWPDGTDADTDNSDLVGSADLSIVKTHPAGPVIAGTQVDYTIQVSNAGPSDSPAGVVVTDTVPEGLVPLSVDFGEGWECVPAGQELTCTSLDVMPTGTSADAIILTVAVPSDGGGTYTNTGVIAQTVIDDPDLTNNTSRDPTIVTRESDVTIQKTADAENVVAGSPVTYTLTVANGGPSMADSLTVTDVLPLGMSDLVITSNDEVTVWDCSAVTSCFTPHLAAGEASVLTVTAMVDASVIEGTQLTNSANVNWTDSRGSYDDEDTADVVVSAQATLTLEKLPLVQTVIAGEDATFTLDVRNLGPSDAAGAIVVEDTLPAGMRYSSVNDGWTCVADDSVEIVDTQLVTCTLGDGTVGIPNGGAALTLTMVTTTDPTTAPGTLLNTATASSPSAAEIATASAEVIVSDSADLSIVKSHDAATVRVGDELDFGFAIANDGPSDAEGVAVLDTLPAELEYVGFAKSAPEWTCVAVTQENGETAVTCELATPILPGAEVPPLVITASVVAEAYPSVVNVAQIGSLTPDVAPDNNRSEDTVEVPPLVWLSVDKKHVGDVRIAEKASYVITVGNHGQTEDPGGFTIVDTLPQSLAFSSFTGEGVDCVAVSQDVTCTFDGPLAVDEERSVTLTVNVLAGGPSEIVNTVVAASLYEEVSDEFLTAEDEATVLPAHWIPIPGIPGIPGQALAATGVGYQAVFLSVLSLFALMLGAGLWVTQGVGRREAE
ncbi:MAG: hypothetical protein ACOH19_05065 [Rhodoglobus sp.]